MMSNKLKSFLIAACCVVGSLWAEVQGADEEKEKYFYGNSIRTSYENKTKIKDNKDVEYKMTLVGDNDEGLIAHILFADLKNEELYKASRNPGKDNFFLMNFYARVLLPGQKNSILFKFEPE